jgi:phosphosulfolactate synthase (CoM biosynthesis protein A)
MKLQFGQYVHHGKYGWGTIVDLDCKRTVVYFRDVGIKKLAGSRTVFDLIEGETRKRKQPAT